MSLITRENSIFIAGHNGMVGRAIRKNLEKNSYKNLLLPTKKELDLSNQGMVKYWLDKNKPEVAEALPSNFLMNMVLGDLVEAVFKGLLREANVEFNDATKVTLKIGDILFTGTPKGVGKLQRDDVFVGTLEGIENFSLRIK